MKMIWKCAQKCIFHMASAFINEAIERFGIDTFFAYLDLNCQF